MAAQITITVTLPHLNGEPGVDDAALAGEVHAGLHSEEIVRAVIDEINAGRAQVELLGPAAEQTQVERSERG